MIRLTMFLLLLFSTLQATAQTASLTGRITDSDTNEPLNRATIQLYRLSNHQLSASHLFPWL